MTDRQPDHAVFAFGDDVVAFPSVASAEGGTEVYDLAETLYIDEDGTVLSAQADGYRVHLTPTTETREEHLRERLRFELQRRGLDPALAEAPRAAAQVLME